jgi:hypothetical protein
MGQRSQLYLKLENIGKSWATNIKLENSKEWLDRLPEYIEKQEIYEKWKQMYGDKETIIVALHSQWLFGRSFVLVAAQIMFAVKSFHSGYDSRNPLSEERDILKNPNEVIDWIKNYMQNLFDYELSKYARASIERLTLLNEEHIEDNELSYSNSCLIGDNNDGIVLMDFTSKVPKYCFMNIHGDSTVEQLPYLCPVDAHTYLKAYYSEDLEILAKKDEEKTIDKTKGEQKNNIRINKKFLKRFNGYSVLKEEEVVAMFPKLKQQLAKENKKYESLMPA